MKYKDSNNEWQNVKVKNYGIEQTPIGGMVYYPSNSIPDGYLKCDGTEYKISDYKELYDVIGDSGGTPSTTGYFKVPNMTNSSLNTYNWLIKAKNKTTLGGYVEDYNVDGDLTVSQDLTVNNISANSVEWNSYSLNNVDLNDYTKVGVYYFGTGCTNAPADYVRVLVMGAKNAGAVSQIASRIGSNIVYVRVKNSTWGSWDRLASYNLNNIATYQSNGDPNTTLEPLLLTSHANGPVSGRYFYIKTMFYTSISATSNRSQIAIGYITREIYVRYYYGGSWSSWTKFSSNAEITKYDGDLNNINETGLFYVDGTATHLPVSGYSCYIESIKYTDNLRCQIAVRVTTNLIGQGFYVREYVDGTWYAWHEVTKCTYLGSGIDCNNLVNPGQYGIYSAVNCPSISIGTLEVIKYSGDWLVQRFTLIQEMQRVWTRCRYNGTIWGTWKEEIVDFGSSSTNLNNVLQTCFIYSSDTTRTPVANNGYLKTQRCSDNYLIQDYTNYNGNGVWRRAKQSGTWGSWLREPNLPAITAYPSSRQTVSSASWASTTVTLASFSANNSAFAISNGGIKVNAKSYGIHKVKVSGTLSYFSYNATGETDLEIYKNSTLVCKKYGACQVASQITSLASAPVFVDVADGDTFYLKVVKGNATSMTILPENASTSLTIEVVS